MKPFGIKICWVLGILSFGFPAFRERVQQEYAGKECFKVDKTYNGKYTNDPRVKNLMGNVEGDLETALKLVAERTGLRPKEGNVIHLKFADGSGMSNARAATTSAGKGQSTITFGFRLCFEDGVDRYPHAQTTFRHELVHAISRLDLPESRYGKLPIWIREGSAVFGSEEHVRWMNLTFIKTGGHDMASRMTGINASQYEAWSMLEASLAFNYMNEKCGADAVKRFLDGVFIQQKNYSEVLKEITQQDAGEFAKSVNAFAKAYVNKLNPSDSQDPTAMVGKWSSKLLSHPPTVELNKGASLEDTVQMEEQDIVPESFRVWIVENGNRRSWILGSIPIEGEKLEKQGGGWGAKLKFDFAGMKKEKRMTDKYVFWYFVTGKDGVLRRLRIPATIKG